MNALTDTRAVRSTVPTATRWTRPAIPYIPYRGVLFAAVAAAVAAGFVAAHAPASARAAEAAGTELTRLLRFMALTKAAFAVGALLLADWRLRRPATPASAASYVAVCALMAAGPGLIWSVAHVAAGAVLFHAGLALLLVLAWTDRAIPMEPAAGGGGVRGRGLG